MVTIEAGPEPKKYFLHKSYLTYYSEYFAKALNGTWTEAKDRVVPFVDNDPDVLGVFVDCLYTQRLPGIKDWASAVRGFEDIELSIVKTTVIGDRFLSPKFYRHVNNYLVDLRCDFGLAPLYSAVIYAFESLPS
jgi:hypothetical protein